MTARTCKRANDFGTRCTILVQYIQPDVVSGLLRQVDRSKRSDPDRVPASGGRGTKRTGTLKDPGRLCRQLYRGGADFLRRGPGAQARGRAWRWKSSAKAAEASRGLPQANCASEPIGVDSSDVARGRLGARQRALRGARALPPAAPRICAKPSESATRSKRSTPTVPPPAECAFKSAREPWSRWRRC